MLSGEYLSMLERWKKLFGSRAAATGSAVAQARMRAGGSVLNGRDESIRIRYLATLLPGTDETPLSVPEKLLGQVVEQQLRNESQRAAAVPRVPTVMPLLLRQLRDPLVSSREYAALILQDPVIATALLKMARSIYFNPYRKALDNFEAVVAALGVVKLRLILSAVVLQPMLRGGGDGLPQQVWSHSLACASCCQHLAEREGVDGYTAYLTGLVHDIGVVTLYNQTQLLSREYLGGAAPSPLLLRQLVSDWSRQLAAWIATDWQLPGEVIEALAGQQEQGRGGALVGILWRANQACEAYALYRAQTLSRTELEQLIVELGIGLPFLELLDEGYGAA